MKFLGYLVIGTLFSDVVLGQDPQCETGLLDPKNETCCVATCSVCTGVGCGHPGNPELNGTECCESEIHESEKSCRYYDPPCIMHEEGNEVVIKHHNRPNCRGRHTRVTYDVGSCFYTKTNSYSIVDSAVRGWYRRWFSRWWFSNVLLVAEDCLNPDNETQELRVHRCYNFDNESLRVMRIRNV